MSDVASGGAVIGRSPHDDTGAAADIPTNQTPRVRLTLWVEHGGRVLLSDARMQLLEAVGETGSLTGAAVQQRVSYRHVWGVIRELQAVLGVTLVESVRGGSERGGSRLTPLAEDLIRRYRSLRQSVVVAADSAYACSFGPQETMLDVLRCTPAHVSPRRRP